MTLNFDPSLPELIADPHPIYRRLREEDPVHWSESLGGWVLSRYKEVKWALADARFSADRITPFMNHLDSTTRARIADLGRWIGMWSVFADPPQHTRLRSLMNKGFTAQALEKLRPRIQQIVDQLLDRVEPTGVMETIRDLGYPLPVTVIGEMIGVPERDLDRLKQWSDEIGLFVGSAFGVVGKWERAQEGMREMNAYFREIIRARQAEPRDDILSALISARERGDFLSEDELISTCILLLFAGHETTTHLIANGLAALLEHPDQLEKLRAYPALIPSAVEELLRFCGPVVAVARIAKESMEIEGKKIGRGQRLFCLLSSADRDPAQFPDPDRLDVERKNNAHVAFGYGIHFCLGAPLARIETQITLDALLRRYKRLELQSPKFEWHGSLVLRGVKSFSISISKEFTKETQRSL